MGEPTTRFRSRMIPLFLYGTVFNQLGFLALAVPAVYVLTLARPNVPGAWWAVLAGCGCCGLFSLAATPILVWLYPVYVFPAGLKAYNFWGVYTTVTWDEITAARPLSLGVVGLVRVLTTQTRLALWVPRFLEDFDQFAELVREYAGPDHPLTRALDRQTDDDS